MKIIHKIFVGIFVLSLFAGFSGQVFAISSGSLPGDNCGYDASGNEIPCFQAPAGDDIPAELNPGLTFRELVIQIINYFLSFVGLAAVVVLVYSGVLWVTSAGESDPYEKGKKGVMYALMGIVLILLSYAIVNWVVGAGGEGTPSSGGTTNNSNGTGSNTGTGDTVVVVNPDDTDNTNNVGNATVVQNDDGSITITFTDGTTTTIYADGTVVTKTPDGITITTDADGNTTITDANGNTTTNPQGSTTDAGNGVSVVTGLDGSVTTYYVDGSYYRLYSNGTAVFVATDGTILTTYPDGTVTVKDPDGTITTTSPDGTVTITDPDGNQVVQQSSDSETAQDLGAYVLTVESGETVIVYTEDALTRLINKTDKAKSSLNTSSLATINRFKRVFDQLYSAIPQTPEAEDYYNYALDSLADWLSDPNNSSKESVFQDDYKNFTNFVKNFPRMTSVINVSPTLGKTPLYVFLDGTRSSDPNNITIPDDGYYWSYIDNSGQLIDLGSGPTKDLTLTEPGSYVINLITETAATANNGAQKAMSNMASVKVRVLPSSTDVNFTINGNETSSIYKATLQEAEDGILFDPAGCIPAENREITEYYWDFGNSAVESRTSADPISTSYNNLGQYKVRLTTTDTMGEKDTKEVILYVQNNVADTTISPEKGTIESTYIFNASGSRASEGTIREYLWEITGPENVQSEDMIFEYKFSKIGDYQAKLTVTDSKGNSVVSTQKFKVHSQAPYAVFEWSVPDNSNPSNIRFESSRSNDPDGDRLLYSWDFGNDGAYEIVNSTDTVVYHDFADAKTYPVKLTVTDPYNESSSVVKNVDVSSTFKVDFTASDFVAYAGQEITFNAISSGGIGFLWNFGDGSSDVANSISQKHVFEKEGKYKVRLTVTNNQDEQNYAEKWVYIGEKDQPLAIASVKNSDFYLSPQSGVCDNAASAYVVTRADTLTLLSEDSVNVDGSKGNMNVQWKFNDNTFSSDKDLRRRFTELTGTHCIPITLNVYDNQTKKTDSETIYFKVENAQPVFDKFEIKLPDKVEQTPVSISLSAISASDPDGNIVQYKWWAERDEDQSEKLDLHTTSSSSSTVTILPRGQANQINRWRFFVEIKDEDGATVTNEDLFGPSAFVDVKNSKNLSPVVDFSVDRTTVKMGETITFTGEATDPQGDDIPESAFSWDFDGDNVFDDTSSGSSVVRRYDVPGEYDVRMKVSLRGLTSSATKKVYVERTSKLPLAAFTYEQTGRKVVFNSTNSRYDSSVDGNFLDAYWDFDLDYDSDGDGVTDNDIDSTEVRPEVIFPAEGRYRVRLTVNDTTNGQDFVDRTIVITKSGQAQEGVGLNTDNMEKGISLTSSNLMTTLFVMTPNKVFYQNEPMDILVFVENADGSLYNGEVEFRVLEGSAEVIPDTVQAVGGEAASTIHPLGKGDLLLEVIVHNTVSGEISEQILLKIE